MQAFLDTLTIAPGPRETFLDRLSDACEGRDVPGGLYNFSKFVWDKPTHHSTGGPPVARNGKVCTNMAITWSHAVESDQSAAAVGEKGQPLSKADLTALHAEYGGELIDMGGEAAVLVLRDFFDNKIYQELLHVQNVDKHMWSYGTCKNKNMRHNTNVTDDYVQGDIPNPNPEKRCSAQCPFSDFPALQAARDKITAIGKKMGFDLANLYCEINYYFDKNSGIGRHGDKERNLVWGGSVSDGTVRFIQWIEYHHNVPGLVWEVCLGPGDCYIMSGKAAGTDWKCSSIRTIRHCAGSRSFVDKQTKIAAKKQAKRKAKQTAKQTKRPRIE